MFVVVPSGILLKPLSLYSICLSAQMALVSGFSELCALSFLFSFMSYSSSFWWGFLFSWRSSNLPWLLETQEHLLTHIPTPSEGMGGRACCSTMCMEMWLAPHDMVLFSGVQFERWCQGRFLRLLSGLEHEPIPYRKLPGTGPFDPRKGGNESGGIWQELGRGSGSWTTQLGFGSVLH